MQTALAAHFLPDLVAPEELAGGTVVVIDVLRASTVICHALAAGARAVIPALEVEEARRIAAKLPPGEAVLGGEREGLPIPGFDLGNSPAEYRPDTVGGRTVVFTTTNGTRAMNRCRQAGRVLVGAMVNRTAVCEAIQASGARAVHMLCAGTRGKITREDVLFAGAAIDRLIESGAIDEMAQNDQARIARAAWRQAVGGQSSGLPATLAAELRNTQGGRNLKAIHLDRDIDDAAKLDLLRVVPELDLAAWRIE
ncbi:MAG TPA: 2-phosphosulfolactate phosphatase [Pirellulales bacterium]|jgi:2-phosphosulfolactate phosphatase|nr:2-phosphosulfolactate phosphatase [Pirellulales bacterium]